MNYEMVDIESRKILIVADIPTHPVIGGNRMCIIQNAEILKKIGFKVYYLFYDETGYMQQEDELCKSYWKDNYFYYCPSKLHRMTHRLASRFLPSLQHKIDFFCPQLLVDFINKLNEKIQFHGLMVNYIWLSKLSSVNILKKVLYTHDVFTNRAQRIPAKYKWMSFSPKEEAKALQRFEYVLAIQSKEATFFSYLAPTSNVIPIYSPIDYIEQPIIDLSFNVLFFSGGGELNILGLNWFIENVHPLLKKNNDKYQLLIGGKICSELYSEKLDDKIKLMGTFDNPSDFYQKGNVVINPIFGGTGLKIKTLEGLAHGKLVIAHPHSAEGLYGTAPVYLSADAMEFASLIIESIDNKFILFKQKERCKSYINDLNEYIQGKYKQIFA